MAKFVPSDIDRLIGQRIQKRRKELGYTAEKLSEYVDISQPQFSRYERGTNKINVAHLVAIATFLKHQSAISSPIVWIVLTGVGMK